MYGIYYNKGPKFLKAKGSIGGYKKFDNKRNFDKTVDFDTQWFIENILEQECIYCGYNEWKKMTADRINNDKGHFKDNIVPACKKCNGGRGNKFSVDEYIIRNKKKFKEFPELNKYNMKIN